jgi:hypothetical protein
MYVYIIIADPRCPYNSSCSIWGVCSTNITGLSSFSVFATLWLDIAW